MDLNFEGTLFNLVYLPWVKNRTGEGGWTGSSSLFRSSVKFALLFDLGQMT